MSHYYRSTACEHDQHDRCRLNCKFCRTPCVCQCHREPVSPSRTLLLELAAGTCECLGWPPLCAACKARSALRGDR